MKLRAIARRYQCDVEALVTAAIDELIAAHEPKPKARLRRKRKPVQRPRKRVTRSAAVVDRGDGQHTCIKDDGGTPGRRCAACDAERDRFQVPRSHDDFDVVWNGTMARRGSSLTSGEGWRGEGHATH